MFDHMQFWSSDHKFCSCPFQEESQPQRQTPPPPPPPPPTVIWNWREVASTQWLCVFNCDLQRPTMWERSICAVTCWHLCAVGLRCFMSGSCWVFQVFFVLVGMSQLSLTQCIWILVDVLYRQQQDNKDNNAKTSALECPPSFLLILWMSSNCPCHPSNQHPSKKHSQSQVKQRERVLIRGMKSRAYGALPPLRGPLLGRHGLKIRASSCVSHSNSALMFERGEKMPALRG